MRTTFMTLIATGTLVLVAAGVAVGQTPAGPITVDISDLHLVSPGVLRPDETRTVYQEQGRQMTMTWQAEDPRLSGEVTCAGNRLVARDGSFVEAEAFVITTDDGRWLGHSTGRLAAQPMPDLVVGSGLLPPAPDHQDVVVLRGDGGYAGLSAVVDIDWSQDPPSAAATIFGGELPTAPGLAVG
jgi:hypothetical protein